MSYQNSKDDGYVQKIFSRLFLQQSCMFVLAYDNIMLAFKSLDIIYISEFLKELGSVRQWVFPSNSYKVYGNAFTFLSP